MGARKSMDLADWFGVAFLGLIVWGFGSLHGYDKGLRLGMREGERLANLRTPDEPQSHHQEPSSAP
jgi:hypothetical protein